MSCAGGTAHSGKLVCVDCFAAALNTLPRIGERGTPWTDDGRAATMWPKPQYIFDPPFTPAGTPQKADVEGSAISMQNALAWSDQQQVRVWFQQDPPPTYDSPGWYPLYWGVIAHFPFRFTRVWIAASSGATFSGTHLLAYDLPPRKNGEIAYYGLGTAAKTIIITTVTAVSTATNYTTFTSFASLGATTEGSIATFTSTTYTRVDVLVEKYTDGTETARQNWNAADRVHLRQTGSAVNANHEDLAPNPMTAATYDWVSGYQVATAGGGVSTGVALAVDTTYQVRVNNADAATRGFRVRGKLWRSS